ncbi:restriction endonuclease subunit S [Dehalococcoidia bacterium]|nr:restriction endonuclease subunit S [Dehalococcoidia bacterium]
MTTAAMDIGQKELPAGWKWVKLGDVAETIRGVNFKKDSSSNSFIKEWVPVLRAGNISDRLITDDDLIWVPPNLVSHNQLLKTGDIAICMSSGSPKVVGKTATLKHEWVGSVGAFCAIVRPADDGLGAYLSHWFKSDSYLAWRDSQAMGSNIQNLRANQLLTIPIHLPPLEEQKRIAGILNEQMAAVEEAKKAAQQRLEAAKALPAAYLREVFPSSEAELPAGWKWVKLGDVAETIRGVNFKKDSSSNSFIKEWVPVLRAGNISDRLITDDDLIWVPPNLVSHNQLLKTGDIAICMSSGSPKVVGKTATLKHEWVGSVGAFCAIVRPADDGLGAYLSHWFKSDSYLAWRDSQAMGSNIQNLRANQLLTIPIHLPPLEEQQRIASELDDKIAGVKLAEASIQQELDTIEAMPAALLRKAFSGGL